MIRKIEINGKIYRLIGEGGGDVDYTLTEEDLKEIAERVKFSTVIEGRISDGIGGKDYDLEIGAEYKFIPNVLETNIFVLFGGKYMNLIYKQDTEPFTLKVIGSENKKVTYEYNGELLTKDYSGYSDLGATYPSALFAYNFKGAIYRAVGDGKTPEKGIDYFTPEDVEAIVNEVAENVTTARIGTVTISADKWTGTSSPYAQVVTVEGVTKKSQVDLTPSDAQLAIFHEKDLAFVTSNYRGVVTVSAIGQKPMNDYEMQVTITEVEHTDENSPIIGVTVGTPISPSKIEEKINPVKTVNNVAPDENGNVAIEIPQGANGKTPYIKDGNWWIGETDTGVKAEGADGVGISKIEKYSTNGKVDTYMITYTNKGASVFAVTNGTDGEDGRGISSIKKTSTNGLVDTYTITFTDNTTATFTVTNGKAGTSVTVSSVSESTADGGSNVVTFSDGKTLTVKNGKNGAEGKTPYIKNKTWWIGDTDTGIKAEGADGKDYVLTASDKTEIAEQAVKLIDGVPDYWLSALEEGAKEINTALCTAGRNKSAFLFYTDAHWGYGSGMSPNLLKYLGKHTGINKTIFGGDFGNTYESPDTGKTMDDWADVMREWKLAVRDIPNHHSVVGNHDKEVDAFNTDKSLYGFLFAPEETNDIVRGGDFFYYIDDVNEKTRYFYLNTGLIDFSDEQCAFLIEGLTSVPSGWHIVAVSHIWFVYNSTSTPTEGSVPTNTQKLINLLDAYNARAKGSVTINSKNNAYDFSTCEGWVEFCIGGHTHVDYSFTSTNGIPIILCQTDSRHLRGGEYTFTFGTTTESSVSGVVADYDSKKIYIIRIGRGESREIEITNNIVSYTNVLPLALSADGVSIYNGKGWKENTRWSSSSNIDQTVDGIYITGYILFAPSDIIRLENITMPNAANNTCIVHLFKALNDTSEANVTNTNLSSNYSPVWGDDGNLKQFTIPTESAYKYMRIQCGGISDASIITINEPID